MPAGQTKARFFEPMLLQRSNSLPEGANWAYEVKLDGYRALAIKTSGRVQLRSRHNKDFNTKYAAVVSALATLPDETVVDGEVVALDDSGRPSFGALQNYRPPKVPIFYYVFDVLVANCQCLPNALAGATARPPERVNCQCLPNASGHSEAYTRG